MQDGSGFTKEVLLKNKTAEPESLVRTTMASVRALWHMSSFEGPFILQNFAKFCKSSDFFISEREKKILKEYGFMTPDGQVERGVRNTILSSYVKISRQNFAFEDPALAKASNDP